MHTRMAYNISNLRKSYHRTVAQLQVIIPSILRRITNNKKNFSTEALNLIRYISDEHGFSGHLAKDIMMIKLSASGMRTI